MVIGDHLPCRWTKKKTPSHRSHQTQEIPNQVYNFYNLSTKFLQFPATAMSAGPKQNRLGSSPEVPSAGPSGWCNCRGERSRIGGGETWANHGASWWIMAGRNSLHRFCFKKKCVYIYIYIYIYMYVYIYIYISLSLSIATYLMFGISMI